MDSHEVPTDRPTLPRLSNICPTNRRRTPEIRAFLVESPPLTCRSACSARVNFDTDQKVGGPKVFGCASQSLLLTCNDSCKVLF